MATNNFSNDYCVEDSDQEHATDSEDEITNFVLGTPQQRRHIKRRSLGQPSDSSEDEFEKEMESELKQKMDTDFNFQKTATVQSKSPKDEDEDENAALFYDPNMDDADQAWVNKQRRLATSNVGEDNQSGDTKEGRLPRTDAVLNCPACLCQLCTDCQRHSVYDGQYRAMFVTNCIISYGETLRFKKQTGKKNRKRKHQTGGDDSISEPPMRSDLNNMEQVPSGPIDDIVNQPGGSGGPDPEASINDDLYNPVHCSNCNTKVALYDQEEVYHFFNVLTSYG